MSSTIYSFADCRLDTGRHLLVRQGSEVHVEPQVFDLLRVLAESAGALVTREDLIERVWGGLNISDATIAARINAARRAAGDDGQRQAVIETVPRRGFRMVAEVRAEGAAPAARPVAAREGMPTLAVLRFRELGSSADDMLADGFVEEITGALSRVHDFHVIARQSAFALPAGTDIPEAARLLGADYLVEGSLQRAGERIRVNVVLADATGRSLWTGRFDDRVTDLFEVQDRIAAQVAGQLPVNLRSAEIARARTHERDSGARDLVLRAMPLFWAHRREANAEAVALLSQALEREPDYPRALAYKAWALAQQPTYLWSDRPGRDRAEALALADRAAERVGDDPGALTALSAAYAMAQSEPSPAPVVFAERALEIDPNNAWGHMRLGWALIAAKRPVQALPAFETAQRLSPLDPFLFNMRFGVAASYRRLDRLADATALLQATMAEFPNVHWAYRLLAAVHAESGDLARATKAIERLLVHYPGLTMRRLVESAPPTMVGNDPTYLAALRAAGLPDD
jgi:TolB-like protein/cytochrome c-type biogenesis protein CcmH/NrfG